MMSSYREFFLHQLKNYRKNLINKGVSPENATLTLARILEVCRDIEEDPDCHDGVLLEGHYFIKLVEVNLGKVNHTNGIVYLVGDENPEEGSREILFSHMSVIDQEINKGVFRGRPSIKDVL